MKHGMRHLMVDLETWDTGLTAGIRSIGAVWFKEAPPEPPRLPDLSSLLGREFYRNVDDPTGTRSDSTMRWWAEQPAETQALLENDRLPVEQALDRFVEFARGAEYVWSHGAAFDVAILSHRLGDRTPWSYKAARDTRTLFDILGFVLAPFHGRPHYALDDARNQAQHVIHCLRHIRRLRVFGKAD